MDREQWRPFLQQWSEEWIGSHDPEKDGELDGSVVRDRWLGFAPASEEEIAAAEARLGRALPASLREFLAVTNGWRDAGCFIYRLAGTAELEWLADSDWSFLIDIYGELAEEEEDEEEAEDADVLAEAKVLRRSLLVSLEGDAADILLDPGEVDERGEWTAYWHASWSGCGLEPFDSFYDVIYDQYKSFHALRNPEGDTKDRWDAEVEEARLAALNGDIEGPLEVLAEAEEFGNERALLLRFQMLITLGGGADGARISHVVDYAHHSDIWHHPIFLPELLPLVFEEDRARDLPYGWSTLRFSKENGPEWVQSLIADHEARRAAPDYRLSFGNPEFDAAVHHLVGRLTADRQLMDAAWPELKEAIRLWRPLHEDHIAPVVLFAHPLLAEMIDGERGREILSICRTGDR